MPLRRSMLIAMVGVLAFAVGGSPVAAEPDKSDIEDAQDQVEERSRDLNRAQLKLATAESRLQELASRAERLVEAYNGELVRLRDAKSRHEALTVNLTGAEAQVEVARKQVAAIAADTYGRLDVSQPMVAVVGEGAAFLRRASLLSQLSDEQSATMNRLRDSQQVHAILEAQAAHALAEQQAAAKEAERLKEAAAKAVDEQLAETKSIKKEKSGLVEQLDAARSKVERIKRERELARIRREQEAAGRHSNFRLASAPKWARAASSGMGGIAAQWALNQLGKPYVWAADGPGSFDCSGLSMRAWERAGVDLDHWTGTQWTSGPHVPLSQLRPGDLLFFGRVSSDPGTIHHVGIFIGRGLMVHAPQTGDVVRTASIWRRDLVGATRPS
ncbi:C40 family peptidase [Acrocarpospora pleiomorpha]|nr:C40 family peptidase [Acrocarpospora pleiomorpha]